MVAVSRRRRHVARCHRSAGSVPVQPRSEDRGGVNNGACRVAGEAGSPEVADIGVGTVRLRRITSRAHRHTKYARFRYTVGYPGM